MIGVWYIYVSRTASNRCHGRQIGTTATTAHQWFLFFFFNLFVVFLLPMSIINVGFGVLRFVWMIKFGFLCFRFWNSPFCGLVGEVKQKNMGDEGRNRRVFQDIGNLVGLQGHGNGINLSKPVTRFFLLKCFILLDNFHLLSFN